MRRLAVAAMICTLMTTGAAAQFTGPSAAGQGSSIQDAMRARVGSYITITGNIVSHLREEYFIFRDATGEIRVEIPHETWRGRQVGPGTRVRVMAEVDRGITGRYLWVKSLDIVE